MQTATRISRHHDIDGDCSICQHLLQGQPVARRLCGHVIHSDCYFDKVLAASTDALVNADSCEACRAEVCSKTRGGKDLTQHFASCKLLVASTAATNKKKGESRGGNPPRLSGPSAGSRAVSAGSKSRGQDQAKRLAKRKANVQAERESADEGGFTSASRGKVRRLGIKVPVGSQNTCLADACWVGSHDAKPGLELKLSDVRAALTTPD